MVASISVCAHMICSRKRFIHQVKVVEGGFNPIDPQEVHVRHVSIFIKRPSGYKTIKQNIPRRWSDLLFFSIPIMSSRRDKADIKHSTLSSVVEHWISSVVNHTREFVAIAKPKSLQGSKERGGGTFETWRQKWEKSNWTWNITLNTFPLMK